jgi:hypothetical protein
MQMIGIPPGMMMPGSEPDPEQLAALQAHADRVHARTHEVEAEIRGQLLFWAPILCSCPTTFTRLSMTRPPGLSECIIHGQAQNLLGERPGCEHDG